MTESQRTSKWINVTARYRRLVHKMANGWLLNSERIFMDYFTKSCYSRIHASRPSDHRLNRLSNMK